MRPFSQNPVGDRPGFENYRLRTDHKKSAFFWEGGFFLRKPPAHFFSGEAGEGGWGLGIEREKCPFS